MPVQITQECARGHHPAEDMGVKGESGITVHNGIQKRVAAMAATVATVPTPLLYADTVGTFAYVTIEDNAQQNSDTILPWL